MTAVQIRPDDLSSADTLALVAAHLRGMQATSPAESVHALDVSGLQHPDLHFFSARVDGALAGIGAWKRLDDERGELKSMRVADGFLGRGVGRALLRHLVAEAKTAGVRSLWLETGSTGDFLAARTLYVSEGFVACDAFPPYTPDPFSAFLTRTL